MTNESRLWWANRIMEATIIVLIITLCMGISHYIAQS